MVTASMAVALGLGIGGAYLGFKRATLSKGHEVEPLCLPELRPLGSSSSPLAFDYTGDDKNWVGTTLLLRHDHQAITSDRAATAALGGRWAAPSEVLRLDSKAVHELLGGTPGSDNSDDGMLGLRVADAGPPADLCGSPCVRVELRPGFGLLDLYGSPDLFKVQEQSVLRRTELARAGKYNAQDIFSGRVDKVHRALNALVAEAEAGSTKRLRVLADGVVPSGTGEALQQIGLNGSSALVDALASLLQTEGAPLLDALKRAQCCAGASLPSRARELWEVLQMHSRTPPDTTGPPISAEELTVALARGFWTPPADESGMHLREREAERLLERSRRELWTEGSASRLELEGQIRALLCRYLLGCAASRACIRVDFLRPRESAANTAVHTEAALRQLRFRPLGMQGGLWYRLELACLEVRPLERSLREGTGESQM